MIDASSTDLRDPIDRTRRLSSEAAAVARGMAATEEVADLTDPSAIGGRISRSSVSSESTIRSGGSPGTKQIETSFCGARPIGSISSLDNCERELSARDDLLSGPFEEAPVRSGKDAISVSFSMYDVRVNLIMKLCSGFFISGISGPSPPPSSTFLANYQSCVSGKLMKFQTSPPPPKKVDVIKYRP